MNPADTREEDLFREALQRAGDPERAAFLDQVCAGNSELRRRLDALLQAHESPAPFLEPPVTGSPVFAKRDFGSYELLEQIGYGGMGVVYKARQKSLDRIVALKLLLFGPHAPAESVKRFRAEAVSTAALQHPNIVAIHEVGFFEGQHFIAMDYVEGRPLSALIKGNPLPVWRAARCLKTIAEAIHYAHERGILHRDLKPANVLIDASELPHVTDFGLARRLEGESELTNTGQVLGSPYYMSPEQAIGKGGRISRRTDVHALGTILYHALTGRPPFMGENLAQTMQQVLTMEPVPPRVLNPSVPVDLETVCLKCLEKDPAKRYPTAQKLAEELGRFLNGEPVIARPINFVGKAWRWCHRQPVRASLVAALLVVCLAGTTAVLWQWRVAERARRTAERAQHDLTEQLYASRLAEARANRWSGQAGRRFNSLDAIRQAAAIRPSLELRNEAIACLALPDIRVNTYLQLRMASNVVEFAFDEAFARYACAYKDGSVSLRRLNDHSEIVRFNDPRPIEQSYLLFSHRGRFLSQRTLGQQNVRVWDTTRQQLVLTSPFAARSLAFMPDDKQVVLAEPGGSIHFYDLDNGAETGELAAPGPVNHLAFDPEGKRLAVSRPESPQVVIFDLVSKTICASFTGARGGGGFMSWSPDGEVLAIPSEEHLYLWNVATGERKILDGHRGSIPAAIFNHAGDLLVSLGWDGTTRLWDPKLAVPLVSIPGGWFQNGFDHSDRWLGFGISRHERGIWEIAAARECRRLGRTPILWSGVFSADGQMLVIASSDGIRFWQVGKNRLLTHLPMNEPRSVMWHPNGNTLIVSGYQGLTFWNLEFSTESPEVRASPVVLFNSPLAGADLSAKGGFMVAAGATQSDLVAFKLDQLSPPIPLSGHERASGVAICPNGKWFASGTFYGTGVKVWCGKDWQPVKELPVNGKAFCAFSPDNRWLLTGSGEEFCLWAANTWEPKLKLSRHQAGEMAGAGIFSPDARMAALLHGRDRGVKLISIPDGKELAFLDTGEPLCFSPDGTLLATTSEDHRNLLVWDLRLIRQELRDLGLDWD